MLKNSKPNITTSSNNGGKHKNGSALSASKNPEWFEIVNPGLTDTNQMMENICSQPEDTFLYETNAVEDDFEALEAEENAQIWPEETNSDDLSEQIIARETEVMPGT